MCYGYLYKVYSAYYRVVVDISSVIQLSSYEEWLDIDRT